MNPQFIETYMIYSLLRHLDISEIKKVNKYQIFPLEINLRIVLKSIELNENYFS